VSIKARVFFDEREIDVMEFAGLADTQPGKIIVLPDARGMSTRSATGTRFRIVSADVTSDPGPGIGDTLLTVTVEP
jgi:hypothetical protein